MTSKHIRNVHLAALARAIQMLDKMSAHPLAHSDARRIAVEDALLLRDISRMILDRKYQPHLFN